jgi:NAD(P)-dependent dehydrogenase (short-subunit alcohol dehydrogenase family)
VTFLFSVFFFFFFSSLSSTLPSQLRPIVSTSNSSVSSLSSSSAAFLLLSRRHLPFSLRLLPLLPLFLLLSSLSLSSPFIMAVTFTGAVPVPAAQSAGFSVLVTGAGRGIGRELVVQYAKAHADNVVIAGVRDPTAPTVRSLSAYPNIHVVQLDVSAEESIQSSVKEVQRLLPSGGLDVLINNAAIIGEAEAANPVKVTAQQFNAVFQTNVTGVLLTTQAYLPLLRKSTVGAKVINVSSSLGSNQYANIFGYPTVSYGLSKAALNYLTTAFRYAEPTITFLSIHPGWVQTEMGNSVGEAPTLIPESVQAVRYYIGQKSLQNTGEYLDTMTGNLIAY